MKQQGFYKARIFPVLFMFLFTVVCIALVSGIFLSTEERVKLNESVFLKRAVLYAAGIAVPTDLNEINKLYAERVTEYSADGSEAPQDRDPANIAFFALKAADGSQDGFALFSYGPGLWAEITALVAFEEDKKTIKGVEFIKQSETPGLGARISEAWFKEQFRGKQGPFKLVPEGTVPVPGEMDAITGASRTSEFVRNIINNSINGAAQLKTAGNGGSDGQG